MGTNGLKVLQRILHSSSMMSELNDKLFNRICQTYLFFILSNMRCISILVLRRKSREVNLKAAHEGMLTGATTLPSTILQVTFRDIYQFLFQIVLPHSSNSQPHTQTLPRRWKKQKRGSISLGPDSH